MEILAMADSEKSVLVTLDKDFGELVFLKGLPHPGIIRLVEIPSRKQGESILVVLKSFESELLRGAIITLQAGRVRVRLPLNLAKEKLI